MASSVSILNNYNGSLFTYGNKELLMQGLMMKQGAYDLNNAKLSQLESQIGSLDLIKDSDKEYLDGRLKEVQNVIKSSIQTGDLSNQHLTDQIISKFQSVIDEPILNAISATRAIRAEEADWQAAREANDGSYSDINYSVMSRNRNKYLMDDRVGVKYSGGGGFVPFTDVNKMLTSKEFTEYLKNSGINAEYVVDSQGNGEFRALNTMEGTVDPGRLRSAVDAFIGEQGRQQLGINAIYNYGYGDTQESVDRLRQAYDNRKNQFSENTESRITAINNYLKNTTLSKEERAQYEAERDSLEDALNSNNALNFDAEITDSDGYINKGKFINSANRLYTSDKMDELFNLTYMKPIFKDRKIDEVAYKTATFNEDVRQFNLNQKRLQQDSDRDFKLELLKEGLRVDENGDIVPNGVVTGLPNMPDNITTGEKLVVTDDEAPSVAVKQQLHNSMQKAVDGIYATENKKWNVDNTSELMAQLAVGDGFAIGTEFNLGGGKKFKVTEANIGYVQELENVAKLRNSGVANMSINISNSLEFGTGKGFFNWANIASDGGNSNNIMLVKDKSTGKFIPKEGKLVGAQKNNLQYLGWKISNKGWESLTENEKATADYYKIRMFQTTGMSKAENALADRMLNQKLGSNASKLRNIEANTQSNIKLKNNVGQIMGGQEVFDQWSRRMDVPTMVSARLQQLALFNEISNESNTVGVGKYHGLKDRDYISRTALSTYKQSQDEVATRAKTLIEKTAIVVHPTIKTSGKMKDIENQYYQNVKLGLGLPQNYKGSIKFERVIQNAKPTDLFNAFIEVEDPKTKVVSKQAIQTLIPDYEPKTSKELADMGVQVYLPEDTPYNVELGNFAAKSIVIPSKSMFSKTVGNTTAPAGTPAYYSDNINQTFNIWQKHLDIVAGEGKYNVYDIIKNDPLLRNPKITIAPQGGSYVTIFGTETNGLILDDNLGETIPTEFVSAYKVQGDNAIIQGIGRYLSKLTGVELK